MATSDYIFFTEKDIPTTIRDKAASLLNSGNATLVCVGGEGISVGTSPEYKFSVSKIAYDKRVYHPGEVHVTMTVTTTDATKAIDFASLQEKAKATFMSDGKHISLVGTRKAVASSTSEDDLVYVAKHYYVQSLSFSTGGGTTGIIIHAFSPDKKLTFDKYCNAYTGKKFGENILCEELGAEGIFQKCDIPFAYNLNHLQRLMISGVELCQPYLVQYNESFHDFMCRVANRCGEFLFYENGALTLGLPDLEPKDIDNISTIYNCPEIDDGGSAIATVDFYSDYTTKNDTVAEKSNYYNGETGADEYFRETTSDDKLGYTDIINWWTLFSAMASGLQGKDFSDLISRMVKDAASNLANGGIVLKAVNDDYEKDYIDKAPDFTRVENKVVDMLSTVYHKHAKEEERATRNLTKLDFQASLSPLMLGDVIKIGGKEHVVTSLQGHYDSTTSTPDNHNRAEAIPFASDGKPIPPVGRVPHILKASPQEAIVASTDDPLRLGRVRITYLWQQSKVKKITEDNNGNISEQTETLKPAKSPWIRIAVPFAGGLGGMVMTPEKESHVMVSYIDNNMERPYVDGALYHAVQKPPTGSVLLNNNSFQPKASRRVIASSSGHSITFIDGKGVANFVAGLIPPLGQIWKLVKGCMSLEDKKKLRDGEITSDEVRNPDSEERQFSGGMVLRDSNDIYNISMSTHGRSISISSPFGKVDVNAFTGITINAPNGEVKIKGKNISLEAGNNISIVAGKNIRPKDSTTSETVAGMLGSIVGGVAAQILVEQSKNFLGFDPTKLTDVSFLRSMWEVLMRPVEGTLSIKSNRNVTMTAGKGKATIPITQMSEYASDGWKNLMNKDEKAAKDLSGSIVNKLKEVQKKIDEFYKKVHNDKENIKTKTTTLLEKLNEVKGQADKITGADKEAIMGLENTKKLLEYTFTNRTKKIGLETGTDTFRPTLNDFIKAFNDLRLMLCSFNTDRTQDRLLADINSQLEKNIVWDGSWTLFTQAISSAEGQEAILNGTDILSDKTEMTRKVFVAILEKYNDQIELPNKPGDLYTANVSWTTFINGIEFKNKPETKAEGALNSFATALGAELLPVVTGGILTVEDGNVKSFDSIKKLVNANGCAGPRVAWDVVNNGNILVSNSAQHTYQLNSASNGWEPVLNPGLDSLKKHLKEFNQLLGI